MQKYIASFLLISSWVGILTALSVGIGWLLTQEWKINTDTSLFWVYVIVGSYFLLLGDWVSGICKKFVEVADDYEKKFMN